MTAKLPIGDQDVLLVVDIQNDFCPEGRLAVPRGDEIVPVVNRLATRFKHVVLTQDWHPPGHLSFASTHPGRQPYDTIAASYGPQILWPDHCVQATSGAEFRKDLQIAHAELILRKGYHPDIDSYSAFYENDRRTRTGLAGYLRERGFTRVFLVGLAFFFACVTRRRMPSTRASKSLCSKMLAVLSISTGPCSRRERLSTPLVSVAFSPM